MRAQPARFSFLNRRGRPAQEPSQSSLQKSEESVGYGEGVSPRNRDTPTSNDLDFERVRQWIGWRLWMKNQFEHVPQAEIAARSKMSPAMVSNLIGRKGESGKLGQKWVAACTYLGLTLDGAIWEARRWQHTPAGKAWLGGKRSTPIRGPEILVEPSDELREAKEFCQRRGMAITPAIMDVLLDDSRLPRTRSMQEWISHIEFLYENADRIAERVTESQATRETMRRPLVAGSTASRAKAIAKRDAKE